MKRLTATVVLTAGLGIATLGGAALGLASVGSQSADAAPHPGHTGPRTKHAAKQQLLPEMPPQSCAGGSSTYTLVNQIKVVQVRYFLYQPGGRHHLTITPTRDAPVSGCLPADGGGWVVDARTPAGRTMASTSLAPGHPVVRCLRAGHHDTQWYFVAALG